MLTICYRAISAASAVLIARELFRQKDISAKINAAIVIVPLVLRALMII
jgi:hypothetical protein